MLEELPVWLIAAGEGDLRWREALSVPILRHTTNVVNSLERLELWIDRTG